MIGWLALALLVVSVLAGGLREPRLAALGAAAAALIAASAAPLPLGPAACWLPWLAWSALGCGLSAEPYSGLPVLARWAAFALFLALASRWDARHRRAWLAAFTAIGAALAAAGLWTGGFFGYGHEMKGLLPPYYNYTAFAVSAAAAAAAAWAAAEPKAPESKWLWALAAALAAAVLLSRSRGALLGLVGAAAWLCWRRLGVKGLLAFGAAVLLAFAALPSARRKSWLKLGRVHGEARPQIWAAAARLAWERPWLGEGPGGFAAGFRRRPVLVPDAPARWGMWTPYAHSEPLQAAAETGLVGFALWLLGLGGSLAGALRRGESGAPREAARAALLAATLQLACDNLLQLTGLSFLYASLLAAAAPASGARGPRLSRAPALAFAAFALAACLPGVIAAKAAPGDTLERRLELAQWGVKLYPADAERREDLAWLFESLAAFPQALAQWEQASRLSPLNAVYSWRRCVLLESLGRPAEAEPACARALDSEPGFLGARASRVTVLASLGRLEEARAEMRQLRRRISAPVGVPESGYARAIVRLEPLELARAEAAARGRDRRR